MRQEVTPLFYTIDAQKREAAKSFFGQFRTRALILSDENIMGGIGDIAAGEFYSSARRQLTPFLDFFKNVEVHLVVTLRDPGDLVTALYSEYLRLHPFVSFSTYVEKLDLSSISLWDTFAWMRSLPKNVVAHIIPYETRLGSGVPGVAATLLRAAFGSSVGFDLRTFYENKVRTSFSAEEVELATAIANSSNGDVARLFLRNLEDVGARFGERRYCPVAPSAAAALTLRYEDDLIRFGVV
jgi:hypothetical protein